MIRILRDGTYELFETKKGTKILILDKKFTFAWVTVEGIGEILVSSLKKHPRNQILTLGKYRLYDVKKEPQLTDLMHLELLVGEGQWQGYLLPHGIPTKTEKRNRIIPTDEVITHTIALQDLC